MRAVLEIRTGPLAGRKVPVERGQTLRVGRAERADLVIRGDTRLSCVHFAIESTDGGCSLRDLASANGTFVEGERVASARLREGDRLRAGETTFVLRYEVDTAPAPSPVLAGTERERRLLDVLRRSPRPLFALLDAARDRGVRRLLRGCREEVESLYDGFQGQLLEDYAPYLVRLPPDSQLLEPLAQRAWGQSWGIFVSSARPFREVRRHFRRFLVVQEDESGDDLYFRFYDPRVLRAFLPCCTPRQAGLLFDGVESFLCEDEDAGALLRFTAGEQGASRESVALGS